MMLDEICERVRRATVSILIEVPERKPPVAYGSGALIALGGVEFVLTAGHNLWNEKLGRREEIAIGQFPRGVAGHLNPGDGSVHSAWYVQPLPGCVPDPDVAVVEITNKTILRSDREPFQESEISLMGPDAPSRQLVLGGFPDDLVDDDQEDLDLGEMGKRTPIDFSLSIMLAPSQPEALLPTRHRKGRGVHVLLSLGDLNTGRTLPETFGMSGGPLVAPDQQGILVGLATSRFALKTGGYDQWCEPALEAIKILTQHDSATVAEAALRIVRRA